MDERAQNPDICGQVINAGGKFERICIEPPHGTDPSYPRTQQHYFVIRYPNRKASEE